jgi:hypothetical protein
VLPVELIKQISETPSRWDVDSRFVYRVAFPGPWIRGRLEQVLNVTVPLDLVSLWDCAGRIELDVQCPIGHWGTVIWDPDQTAFENSHRERRIAKRPLQKGDLLIGECLGDGDVILVRADQKRDDFGGVVVLGEDPRTETDVVADSILQFVEYCLGSPAKKFWEP